uniref:HECT domain-containing protein n=1 Tax=viral metagenome TaxID=1070528 RepID=A0A6C0LE09_9ZZZZ
MPIRLNDEQCLLWIKDPSVSPFENDYIQHKRRKNILSEANIKNPKSFLNKVKRKCFHNSAIRQQIVDKIKEYQKDGTLRLYTLNDKLASLSNIEYITPPFTRKECERWLKNHLENPRPTETTTAATGSEKVYDKIRVGDRIYIELIYISLQYGLPTPSELDSEPPTLADKFDNNLQIAGYRNMNKLIINIKNRLEFMKETDNIFLNHNVGSFDEKLKIASPTTPRRKAAAKTANAVANIAINPFDVSSSTSKSLNSAERRQLRDIILENKEEEKSIGIHQYNKGLAKKKDKISNASSASGASSAKGEEIDNTKKEIFTVFRMVLLDLQKAVMKQDLVKTIIRNASDDNDKKVLTDAIRKYFDGKGYNNSYINRVLKENNYDTIEGIIRNFINNMYVQLIDPSTEELPNELEIGVLSYTNKLTHLKTFYECDLYDMILEELYSFIRLYISVLGKKVYKYFIDLTDDTIGKNFVSKRAIDNREMILSGHSFQNFYYKILYTRGDSYNKPKNKRLPLGRGLLLGKELTKKIVELKLSFYLEYYPANNPDIQTIITDTKVRGFTYEECKNWVILPILNPRTFKEILIDSPIYNTLLLTSYQYDTNLIPRMITSRGYNIIRALNHVIDDILFKEEAIAQSREELENFVINGERHLKKKQGKKEKKLVYKIGLKWKNAGTKKPKEGAQLNGLNDVLKSKGIVADRQPPFYILLTEHELATTGITTVAKNSYIEIAAYYVPDISGRRSGSKVGSIWKKVVDLKEGEGIEKEGVEINNKGMKKAILILKSLQGDLPPSVSFSKTYLATFGITTEIAKNSYIKLAYYYKPVFEKSESDIKIKPTNNAVIINRDPTYVAHKYYTVVDCLRWARKPNKDPKNQQIILTDSKEYNRIFEQALLYDYNITPINITANGKKFMKRILKFKNEHLTIVDKKKQSVSRGKDITDINSVVCNAINNIYDDETTDEGKKYKMFKDLMIGKCQQFNKDPVMCITDIRNAIEDYFYPEDGRAEYKLAYYEESALASLLNFYDRMKDKIYKEEFRDIFIYDFNKFYVSIYEIDENLNEIKKDAIDAGGPKREFFTKLFEELFCDNEHPTRLFACPVDIIGNKYYINPNFEPSINFLKVIAVCRKKNSSIPEFKTERDYEYIYYVVGKLLCLSVYNEEIGLPKQFSSYILAGLIYQPSEFNYYDLLYFYLCEFNNAVYYINMISNRDVHSIEDVMMSFNDTYNISRAGGSDGANITKANCIKFLLQQAKHAVTKNYISKDDDKINSNKNMKRRYDSLFAGFSNEIRKFLYKKKISIEQLSSLITNEQLTEAILQELVDKIEVEIPEVDDQYNRVIIDSTDKINREIEMKTHISNMIMIRRNGVSVKDHLDFIKKLLQYWTAFNYFNRKAHYNIIYKYGQGINVRLLPVAHTCFNAIDVYGFPDNTTPQEKDKFLYDKFKIAVEVTGMELR